MKAGVLALQGDFREHARAFADAGAAPIEVRTAEDLAHVECLAIPGGESTTISKLARSGGLVEPIAERAAAGMPILGTCAGMIVMATRVEGLEPLLGLGVFIRAPVVEEVGAGVRVLSEHEGRPVVLEQGKLVVASFHPELVGETGLHEYLLGKV
jgi:5'-phosphate synthase pdxT subunit